MSAQTFTPMSAAEMEELQQRAATVSGAETGAIEGWKTTRDFDGTAQ